ncbi:MAG: hypothetical protein OEL53_12230 [Rhodospirillales bacterium]|nr:hypothetical protein [Rhodospirillales bacterium]
MFKLLHAGFDTLDVAFQGALPPETLESLKQARDRAAQMQEPALVKIGPGYVPLRIQSGGMRGGYAYVADAGLINGGWRFKANPNPTQWNIFASPSAAGMAALGFHGMRERMFEQLAGMGAIVTGHSINRTDFAMDFLAPGFELCLDQFVAHAHCKKSPHWGEASKDQDRNQPSAVLRGRALESVTIGKMPGRQIIVYDKRRETIAKHKKFWFQVWGVDPADPIANIWRVEVRAGKKELKERWAISTFEDIAASIGDVVQHALSEVRYLEAGQTDSNVTRQRLHPLWQAAQEVASRKLVDYRSGLTPGQLLAIEREQAMRQYRQMMTGNAIGFAVASGHDMDGFLETFPERAKQAMTANSDMEIARQQKTAQRARERLVFLEPDLGKRLA